jgi:uncharacterized protein YjiS (DUF1127 family)
MNASTQRIAPTLERPDALQTRVSRGVRRLPTSRPRGDSTHVMPPLGEEAWPWHVVAAIAPANASKAADATSVPPLSMELYHEARLRQAAFLGDVIAWAIRAAGAGIRKALADYRRYRRSRATYEALRSLDDRTLHDLGFARDEIRSVAAEMAGETEHSRRLARPTYPARPSLFQLLLGP